MANEHEVDNRHDWIFGTPWNDILANKKDLIESYISDMLDRTQEMFVWNGLPDTIPQRDLELILQCKGNATIAKVDEKLYAFWGNLGGKLNEYYFPVDSIVTNPYLNLSKTFKIGEDCVVIKNDAIMSGNMPRNYKYATLIAECDISIKFGSVNKRIVKLVSADNDSTKADAEKFLKDVEEGKKLGVIGNNAFFAGVQTHDFNSASVSDLKDLIELRQYLMSCWFIEYGLNANYNMKREAINENEAGMNEDSLTPLVDNLLKERKEGAERVNAKFGTKISVELNSAWQKVHQEYFSNDEDTKDEPEKESDSNEKTERDNQ